MNEVEYESYFRYLLQRSRLALLYRRRYLYPRLSRLLDGTVLDVGCGIGDFLAFREKTIGVDVNPCCVKYCRKKNLEAYLVEGNRYPFSDGGFDGVVMDNVLEHLVNPSELLAEVCRILRPFGVFIVGVPGVRGYEVDPDHKCFYNKETLVGTIEAGGFEVRGILHMPFNSSWFEKTFRQYCVYGVFRRRMDDTG